MNETLVESIARNLRSVMDRIRQSCEDSSRDPSEVTLVAVTKNRSVEEIAILYHLGVRDFGENRWQEAKVKIAQLPLDIRWHYIGALQTNKAKAIAEKFPVIHTLTSERQLIEICRAEKGNDVFVEVNIAGEIQKAGVPVNMLDESVNLVVKYKQVCFRGLMTIGPKIEDPEDSRIYFRELRKLNDRFGGKWLSMGMSHDFDVAITEGSTHVRVGSALFGGM